MNRLRKVSELCIEDIPELQFISTGTNLDNVCGGFPKKGISVICGSSGQGKSFALLHTALSMSLNTRILYVSIENAIQVDKSRFDGNVDLYKCNVDNIDYLNVPECDFTYDQTLKQVVELMTIKGQYDAVIIDGGDILVSGDDGGKQYENGNKTMQVLKEISERFNVAVLMSWQLGRGSAKKEIEDITTDDIATSMGIARYASLMWAVIKRKKEHIWSMRLIKSRFNFSDEDTISVLGKRGEFNLNGGWTGVSLTPHEQTAETKKECESIGFNPADNISITFPRIY